MALKISTNMPKSIIPIPRLTPEEQESFWGKINKNGPTMPTMDSQCWEWQRARIDGYGTVKVRRLNLRTHRVAFLITGGILTNEKPLVCHQCDNRKCCNPEHLFAGSVKDNVDDMVSKNRNARGERNGSRLHPERYPKGSDHYSRTRGHLMARGESHGSKTKPDAILKGSRHPQAKLTEQQVIEIRNRHSLGGGPSALGREFGISQSVCSAIVRRKIWKHIR